MRNLICSLSAVLFLAAVSSPVLANQAKTEPTPTAQTMKHKKVRIHKKKTMKKKGTMKAKATPSANK